MSRLDKIQKKRFVKYIVSIILIIFVFLYFFLTFGISLLIKISASINNLFNKNNQEVKIINKINNEIALIDIINIPTATNSAEFIVKGSVINLDKLIFYLNDEKVKEIKIQSDIFEETLQDLKKGNNSFYVIGKNNENKITKKTPLYNIFYKPDKPKLEIKEPLDNLTTDLQEIKIAGETDKETFIKINDLPVVVDALGAFSSNIKLNEGENKIKITAEDQAGNIEEKIITIFYQKED